MIGRRIRAAAVAFCAVCAIVFNVGTPQASADTFMGWEYTVSVGSSDGLRLTDVFYDGTKIFDQISLPVMNVFYQNNACGPYTDFVGGSSYQGPFGSDFTQNGVRWRSIGITDFIGQYEITMYYYMSENGDFDAHMFSRGLQCRTYHEHLPFWRLDFDLAGSANDRIFRSTGNGNVVAETREFNRSATDAVNHGWEVRDTVTGDRVTIDFDDGTFSLPGTVVPETDYAQNGVYGRQYRSTELTWQGGASRTLPFGNTGETMSDVVLWYSGYMPHTAAEGSALWHSTGIRLRVNPGVTTPTQSTIGDRVTDTSGAGVGGVKIDLFAQDAQGRRSTFLGTTETNGSGFYGFEVDPGCYTVVFIAPDGRSFQGGSRYAERRTCVDGTDDLSLDAVLLAAGGAASIGDRVTFSSSGAGAQGVDIDLFAAVDGSRLRAEWLGSTTSAADGTYRFPVTPGCYVVVFIAPSGQNFVNGGRYSEQYTCVSAGQNVTTIDAVLDDGGGGSATIGDRVTFTSGTGVAGVDIDLFAANGDGTRAAFLGSTSTGGAGYYRFDVTPGCYVVVFIAPDGRTWSSTGGRWKESRVCVTAGQTNNSIDAVLR